MIAKNILKSLTMQGVAATGAGTAGIGGPISVVLNAVGVPIEGQEVGELIDAGFTIIGLAVTVVGRMRATTPVTLGRSK